MNFLNKVSQGAAGLSFAVTLASLACFAPQIASAQPAYGSYIGVGPAIGVTSGGPGENSRVSALVTARYKFLELPFSLRANAFLFGGTTAIVPMVSYDIPVSWQSDIYLGAGYSFADGNEPSPIGNRSAFVLQPGIDYMVPDSNLALFGSAIFAFNAFKGNGGMAISVQGGVGVRF